MSDEGERDSLITSYFYEGYTYSDICAILSQSHNILISSRQLIRINKNLAPRINKAVTPYVHFYEDHKTSKDQFHFLRNQQKC